ncbi:hypothetical protein C7999DRAFT_14387 [Corynascus novoguineensis]|uniref:Phenazine biosynthesis protein n=1 Tax=Corynascus novoguineensis TaxID=1126955 RepID=A0AAN7CTB3_9PEZI|nr:hypothetical protein C7999DRAFT_14387 [Corynascus novoguineensis]
MPSVSFTIADVFSTTLYKGNPLAIVDAREETLTDTQLKLITRQFNLSETTFFFPPTSPKADFKLRSFLPDGKEVIGAGHNILGVWWHLAQANLLPLPVPQAADENFVFHQELGGQVMPVRVTRHTSAISFSVSIRQSTPHAHATHPDPTGLALSLGLRPEDIGFEGLPPQVMSTSTTRHLLVPLSSVAALNQVTVAGREALLAQLRRADNAAYGLYLFTPEAGDGDGEGTTNTRAFQARFFSPGMSGEDPATGSAAGPLAAYLYRHRALKVDGRGAGKIIVRQGLRVGRECVIEVELGVGKNEDGEEVVEVDLVGGGVQVAEGRIAVPDVSTQF